MPSSKMIESPEKEFELPLKKNKNGDYIVIPKKRGYSGITVNNKKNNPDGYLYFIRCKGTNLCKIGVSSSPNERIKVIDSYMPFDLDILSLHFFKNVYDIESELAKRYEFNNIRKEWYEFDIHKMKEIMIYLHNLNVKNNGSA